MVSGSWGPARAWEWAEPSFWQSSDTFLQQCPPGDTGEQHNTNIYLKFPQLTLRLLPEQSLCSDNVRIPADLTHQK